MFQGLIKWVHVVNYQAVIDLSICAQKCQDLKEERWCDFFFFPLCGELLEGLGSY